MGLFGECSSSAIIKNLTLKGNVKGEKNVGLLCGSGGKISNCIIDGTVSGSSRVGGCVGSYPGGVTDVSSTVVVIAEGGEVGGIVGYTQEIVKGCKVNANISGVNYTGGICGAAYKGIKSITVNSLVMLLATIA